MAKHGAQGMRGAGIEKRDGEGEREREEVR